MKMTFLKVLACATSVLPFSSAQTALYQFTLTGDTWTGYWYMELEPATAYAGNLPPDTSFAFLPGERFLVSDVQGQPGSLPGFTFDYVADVTFWNAAFDGGLTLTDFYADPDAGGVDILVLNGPQLYSGTEAAPVFAPTNGVPYVLRDWQDSNKRYTLSIEDCHCAPVLTPVPEPASWLFMLAGFGALGCALRSRKAIVRFA